MASLSIDQKRVVLSAAAALGVHVLLLVIWILFIVWDLPLFAFDPPAMKPRPEPEVTVVMLPYVQKPPPQAVIPKPEAKQEQASKKEPPPVTPTETPKPEPEAEESLKPLESREQQRRFARTSADQEGEPDAPTDILGERNTRAASELAPTPGADANTPSQDGEAPLYPGQVETVTSTYQDGSVGKDSQGEETETPQEASASKDNELINARPKLEAPEPEETASSAPKNKHLAQGQKLPAPQGGEGRESAEEEPKAEDAPRERADQGANKEGVADATEQDPKKEGFSGHSRQTKVTGSISRQGKSALNVKNSPLGRYQALVSKAVELQWRRNCEQHRDHIVPGVISIRFYVDQNGRVSGVQFQEVIGANYIERGFTQRAIRQASLPKMSESVLEELKGEPLELIYNFYF